MIRRPFLFGLVTAGFFSISASDAVQLNENGWLFPLSRYSDWKGKTARQTEQSDSLVTVTCQASPNDLINIRSGKLTKDLGSLHLPDWEYTEMTLPAVIAKGVTNSTLQLLAKREDKNLRYSFVMRGADGLQRTYSSKSLFTREKFHGPLNFSELSNLYFTYRTPEDAVLKFGDLQVYLSGKMKLTSVPVADAAFVDSIPGEADWENAPSFSNFQNSVRAPAGSELKAPTTVKFLHDAKCLYVRFDQKTDTSKLIGKQNRDGQIWRDDSFQVLLSPGNDNRSYHQFVVNPAGMCQSYHHVFDQVADGYIRATNLRPDEWKVTVHKTADSWSAVFAIQKTLLDKYAGDPIHGLQLLADNSASGGGLGFLNSTGWIFQLSEAGVLRLLSKGKPASRPFPEAPALFSIRASS